jgi:Holliday junction resolvase RusA-like endonuclease
MIEESVSLTVDWIPPSVNHYKKPVTLRVRGGGTCRSYARTDEANAFRDAVVLKARGRTVAPVSKAERDKVRYAIQVTVYLGAGERGDGDNFLKCIADSLQHAGVIHSDARVRRWMLDVEDCDRENPRTEIVVWRVERRLK